MNAFPESPSFAAWRHRDVRALDLSVERLEQRYVRTDDGLRRNATPGHRALETNLPEIVPLVRDFLDRVHPAR